MCGIFGCYQASFKRTTADFHRDVVTTLFRLSESRGKEAAGLALADGARIEVLRAALPAGKFIATREFDAFWNSFLTACSPGAPFAAIGHARLVTNGLQDNLRNNQPVIRDSVTLIHNGIILNEEALWQRIGRLPSTELDSEVLAASIAYGLEKKENPDEVVESLFRQVKGNASIAFFAQDVPGLFLYTNNASLYQVRMDDFFFFASERLFLQQLLKAVDKTLPGARDARIARLANNALLRVREREGSLSLGASAGQEAPTILSGAFRRIEERTRDYAEARAGMRRCTRCILPETMPFIEFDEEGVCSYCRTYVPMPVESKEAALAALKKKKRGGNPDADSLFMLSGGRDSCFGLHYAVRELGLTPIAYTYDWGMITDIARRNAALMCGELGVEHIIVSADIAWKRANVRKNLHAWLKKPELA